MSREETIGLLETSLDSFHWCLVVWTAVVVFGLIVEYGEKIWIFTKAMWAGVFRNEGFPWSLLEASLIGGILITVGVTMEVWVEVSSSRVETKLREAIRATVSWGRLDDAQQERIAKRLEPYAVKRKVVIRVTSNGPSAYAFAEDLLKVFGKARIDARPEPPSPGQPTSMKRERPPFLLFVSTDAELPFANELIKALRGEAILNLIDIGDAKAETYENHEELTLLIGEKSP